MQFDVINLTNLCKLILNIYLSLNHTQYFLSFIKIVNKIYDIWKLLYIFLYCLNKYLYIIQ